MRRRATLAVVGALALFLGACPDAAPRAQDPYWGKQACAHCAMLVSEKPPAAQALLESGQRKYFDDVGCLVAWEARESPKLKAHWVRAPTGDGWVDATTARFSAGNTTPMDFGFLPAAQGVTFDEVRAAVAERLRSRQ